MNPATKFWRVHRAIDVLAGELTQKQSRDLFDALWATGIVPEPEPKPRILIGVMTPQQAVSIIARAALLKE